MPMSTVTTTAPLLATGSGAVSLVCLVAGMALIVTGTAHGVAVSRRASKVAQVTGELEAAQRRHHPVRRDVALLRR
jgi:methylase of polypeptide subunit release factors